MKNNKMKNMWKFLQKQFIYSSKNFKFHVEGQMDGRSKLQKPLRV